MSHAFIGSNVLMCQVFFDVVYVKIIYFQATHQKKGHNFDLVTPQNLGHATALHLTL